MVTGMQGTGSNVYYPPVLQMCAPIVGAYGGMSQVFKVPQPPEVFQISSFGIPKPQRTLPADPCTFVHLICGWKYGG